MKKLQVPYNLDPEILRVYERYSDAISEIYFAPHPTLFPTARQYDGQDKEEYNKNLCRVCAWGKDTGINTMLLLNGMSVIYTNDLFIELAELITILSTIHLTGVVVANPIIAEWVHQNFPRLKIRLSVLSNEDDITKLKQLEVLGYFNEICLPPRWIRDVEGLKKLKEETNFELSVIINGLCRINCPLYGWHHCIFNSNSNWNNHELSLIADTFVSQTRKLEGNILKSPTIFPEELNFYDQFIDKYKMEDRTLSTQELAKELFYYANRINADNFNDLQHGSCMHSPIWDISMKYLTKEWRKYTYTCKGECYHCKYCDTLLEEVLKNETTTESGPYQ